jgi:hypothetical protein
MLGNRKQVYPIVGPTWCVVMNKNQFFIIFGNVIMHNEHGLTHKILN